MDRGLDSRLLQLVDVHMDDRLEDVVALLQATPQSLRHVGSKCWLMSRMKQGSTGWNVYYV